MDRPPMRDDRVAPDRTPFQFTLRTLMIIITVAAVIFSGLFAGPDWLSAITAALFVLAIPLVLTVVLVYGRGYGRTFCIGALFPTGVLFVIQGFSRSFFYGGGPFWGGMDGDRFGVIVFLTVYCILALMAGLLAMGVRKMVEGAGRQSRHAATLHTGPPLASGALPAATDPGPYWDCVSCGKTVPVGVDLCSNCSAPRVPEDQPPTV